MLQLAETMKTNYETILEDHEELEPCETILQSFIGLWAELFALKKNCPILSCPFDAIKNKPAKRCEIVMERSKKLVDRFKAMPKWKKWLFNRLV